MKKPSLADLAQPKPATAMPAPPVVTETQSPSQVEKGRAGAQPDGRKGLLIRVSPEGWRQLRDLAAELTINTGRQASMQSLVLDAINDTLKRHGRPPVA